MQNPGCGLPRNPLPRTPVNRVRWPNDERHELQAGVAEGYGTRRTPPTTTNSHPRGGGHLRDTSIERGEVSKIETLWFLVWRMTLWGLELGLGLGVVHGSLAGAFAPFGIGLVIMGLIVGPALGLCLGPLEGVVLWGVTMLHHRGGTPRDSDRYRRAAGLACATVCIVALALIFELTLRMSGTSFLSGPAAYDDEDVKILLLVVVAPSLSAAWAAWWAARRVAGQYAREIAAE
jgi:hypothetical protein